MFYCTLSHIIGIPDKDPNRAGMNWNWEKQCWKIQKIDIDIMTQYLDIIPLCLLQFHYTEETLKETNHTD